MHLLAESGATKTDWFLFTPDYIVSSIETASLNPTTKSVSEILAILSTVSDRIGGPEVVSMISFYGSGLGTDTRRAEIRSLLNTTFPASSVTVLSDLDGAGHAFYGTDSAGLFCILGTGSACCYHDGSRVTDRAGGHGYLFGDEAGSVDLGRVVVKSALDGNLSYAAVRDLKDTFREEVEADEGGDVDLLDLRDAIYSAHNPSQRLAQLSEFVKKRVDEGCGEMAAIVRERLDMFFECSVTPMVEKREGASVHVTGSLAVAFEDMVREAGNRCGVQIGRVMGRTGSELVRRHQEQMRQRQIQERECR